MAAALTDFQLLTVARRVARAAALIARSNVLAGLYTGTVNEGGDRVLEVDRSTNNAAITSLAVQMMRLDHGYSLFSEESGYQQFGAEYPLFVLDPVDGSAQARRRHPDCAVSLAVARGSTLADVVAGVVQPITGTDAYEAVRGRGARCGRRRLPLNPVPDGPATSVLVEGSSGPATAAMVTRVSTHDPECQIQASGSIALQLSLLGAGCYDALVAARRGASSYDIAAALLILREAGAHYTDLDGIDTDAAPLVGRAVAHHPVAARRPDLLETILSVARATD